MQEVKNHQVGDVLAVVRRKGLKWTEASNLPAKLKLTEMTIELDGIGTFYKPAGSFFHVQDTHNVVYKVTQGILTLADGEMATAILILGPDQTYTVFNGELNEREP